MGGTHLSQTVTHYAKSVGSVPSHSNANGTHSNGGGDTHQLGRVHLRRKGKEMLISEAFANRQYRRERPN